MHLMQSPSTAPRRPSICRFLLLLCALVLFATPTLRTQTNMPCHNMGKQTIELPPPEKLPAPLKMIGIGNSHFTITASPEAQLWFNQGLNLLHDFWDYESERAFVQATRVDPQCAMCFWGIYQSLISRGVKANAYTDHALANALRLKDHASKHEQLYIEAEAAGDEVLKAAALKAAPDQRPDNSKETLIWRHIVRDYPDDLQAKIFLSTILRDGYDEDGNPRKGTKEAIAILQEVLKTNPNDSAANHYWIHAVEAGPHPEQALPSATLLASLAPASGHMVHMPGHIFYRVGDYNQAEHWFAASTAVDEDYMRTQHIPVDDDWNYVHNLMYAIANFMEEGKLHAAVLLSAKLPGARGQLVDTLYVHSPRDSMARLDPQLPIALRTGDWPAVLALLRTVNPDAKLENLTFLSGQLKQFSTGMMALESGDLSAAQTASLHLDADLWRLSQKIKDVPKLKQNADTQADTQANIQKDQKIEKDSKDPKEQSDQKTQSTSPLASSVTGEPATPVTAEVMPDALPAPLLASLSIMSLELRATLLAAQKQLPASKALFAQAAREEKALGYNEPPRYIRPVGETEGAALLAAGDSTGAHQAYADALAERPNSGFSLYGMARSSEAAHNTSAALTEYAHLLEAWKNSDPDNPQLTHAREFILNQKTEARVTR